MRILIYGLNFSPELAGIGKYTGEMAQWLAERDHEVRVITTVPYYPEWQIGPGYSGWRYLRECIGTISVFRTPLWVPEKPKTITRLLHLASFALSSLPQLLRQLAWQPDVIICIAPSFFCAPTTILFSKLSNTCSWLHIQDFEIDAMFGLGMLGDGGVLARFALGAERLLMRRFDRVSSISRSMCARLKAKGVAEQAIVHFPNWVDTDFITPQADRNRYRQQWGFNVSDNIILYSGNLGKKQGLEIILEAAMALREKTDLHFVIVGEGAHKTVLVDAAKSSALHNVHFYPLQSYQSLPDLLQMADVHLVIQKRGAADAVMPSKLTGILSAGGDAIITADADTELGKLVQENPGVATLIEPENADVLVAAIVELVQRCQTSTGGHNQIARRYAVENLGMDSVLGRFEETLREVVNM
ncbi:glycosyltransferase WbuB [Geobacter sp. SVR]|uniref:glycosyltransferase WbuB n=1 Tax=Geobacter sp. SVR TaxID=2495594 RepID=UPI00143F0018|nr:glycosyltransferase WbuB [Geobacter sp. SVR]BCS55017.1 colanic acid biosynthesis glycosyltransferase WcaI [Geobacter sp. SVR]GCF85198.1 colanic acid biosynthesis glycosyltransferase WcaI [Geobacter sp. SVR]